MINDAITALKARQERDEAITLAAKELVEFLKWLKEYLNGR
jgi:hypothetical protein